MLGLFISLQEVFLVFWSEFRSWAEVKALKGGAVRSQGLGFPAGVLPAGGRYDAPSPGARRTPGCGYTARRGEADPKENKGCQNRNPAPLFSLPTLRAPLF